MALGVLLTLSAAAPLAADSLKPRPDTQLALFQEDFNSELTYNADIGQDEASAPSRRQGVELSAFYTPLPWLTFDGDIAFSRARFTDEDDGTADTIDRHPGSYIPGAAKVNASAAVTIDNLGPWQGALEYRYFGPRPLLEDGSVRSGPTVLFNAKIGYKITENITAQVDIFNLFDSHAHQIDYYYPSQLPGESAPVNDIHFHPVEPRSARFTVRLEL